jgi:hypothetical protein
MKTILIGELYNNVVKTLLSESDAGITFDKSNLPKPPHIIESDGIIIKKGLHIYNNSFRVDTLDFFASKENYAQLGLLILSAVFWSEPRRIQLNLINSASDIKYIILKDCHAPDYIVPGYHTRPHLLRYFPKPPDKHPWVDINLSRHELPQFRLTNLKDFLCGNEDFDSRDTVIGFGSDRGCANFAELLLNINGPDNKLDEFHLECDAGFCGVNTCSAEVRIWLPNSFGWIDFETKT